MRLGKPAENSDPEIQGFQSRVRSRDIHVLGLRQHIIHYSSTNFPET